MQQTEQLKTRSKQSRNQTKADKKQNTCKSADVCCLFVLLRFVFCLFACFFASFLVFLPLFCFSFANVFACFAFSKVGFPGLLFISCFLRFFLKRMLYRIKLDPVSTTVTVHCIPHAFLACILVWSNMRVAFLCDTKALWIWHFISNVVFCSQIGAMSYSTDGVNKKLLNGSVDLYHSVSLCSRVGQSDDTAHDGMKTSTPLLEPNILKANNTRNNRDFLKQTLLDTFTIANPPSESWVLIVLEPKLFQEFVSICWVVPPPSNSGNEGLGWDSLLKM